MLSAVATWPLLRDMPSLITSDAGDPALNTSILEWNASVLPFSPAWWNAPHYYPTEGVIAFTENLVGLSPIFSPLYWLTGNPVLAYNFTVFVTWPLSAFAVFLFVRSLTRRDDAAFLAGLSFGFTPYRAASLGHIQTLAVFGIPLFLFGLHKFLETRRLRWLLLFGAAWLQQSLANGYYILFGAVFVAAWLCYFCSLRTNWNAAIAIVCAWALASLPLAPMLLEYRAIHQQFGLSRSHAEILYYSATPQSWLEVSGLVSLWHNVFPEGKDNLFPGVTAIALVAAGALVLLRAHSIRDTALSKSERWMRIALGAGVALSAAAIAASLSFGWIDSTIAGIPFRMTSVDRALVVLALCGAPLAAITPATRNALARRSPFVFYIAATALVAVLCFGPVLRVGEHNILSPAPYAWLMTLPGFDELRVVTQFKMFGVLSLSVAAGLAYVSVRPAHRTAAGAFCLLIAIGFLADGWMQSVPMASAPERWTEAEPADRHEPILELPLGPDSDYAATFRASAHRRRVVNGVSGYDPPHYVALVAGLKARDPAMLSAIASLGAYEIVVNREADADGALERYAANAPGAVRVADAGRRIVYRVPQAPVEPGMGIAVPIVRVKGIRNEGDWPAMHDGRIQTGWGDYPQKPDAWVVIDLGSVREVAGITHAIGDFVLDFPRRLAIEVSTDEQSWERVWEGATTAQTFLAYVREPRVAGLRFPFETHQARFVRLRQLEHYPSMWRVSELTVHAPR